MKRRLMAMASAGGFSGKLGATLFSSALKAMSRKKRMARLLRRRAETSDRNPAGTKLLKRFNASGNRAKHAMAVQHPCYGRRSERAKE